MTMRLEDLTGLMERLRGPEGCPWDKEQTLETLKSYVVEEAYEVLDAIDSGSASELREELGDLLFQIVFQAQLAREAGWFDIGDVIESIHTKMVRRHPHVFGTIDVSSADEVAQNWEAIKKKEGKSRFGELPRHLPSLIKALRVSEKAAMVGFDWADASGPREKVSEELAELDEAIVLGQRERIESEFGDLLLALVNLARWHKFDPETALAAATRRFTTRFERMASRLTTEHGGLDGLTLTEMDRAWDQVKAEE